MVIGDKLKCIQEREWGGAVCFTVGKTYEIKGFDDGGGYVDEASTCFIDDVGEKFYFYNNMLDEYFTDQIFKFGRQWKEI